MNIIMTMTRNSSAAVERFSPQMRANIAIERPITHLKAFLSAPLSVCNTLYICAVASTMVPLAISDGWKLSPKILSQRLPPLMF